MEDFDQGFADGRFASTVDEDLHCAICLNVLNLPVQCQKNEHHFCTPCITRHLRDSSDCPCCKEELSVETLKRPARYFTKVLSQLRIRCDYESRGCPEFVELEVLANHVAVCGFAPVSCSNEGCGKVINRQDKVSHEIEICEFSRAKCHNCAELKKEMGKLREDVSELKISFEGLRGEVCKIVDENMKALHPRRSTYYCPHGDAKKDVIVIGGYNGVNRLRSAEIFVWSKLEWLPLDSTCEPRSASSSAVYKNQILVAGGRHDHHTLSDSIETLFLEHEPCNWRQHPARLPYPCSAHSCILLDDRLIVIGGLNGYEGEASDEIHEVVLIPPYTSTLLTHMPIKRQLHASVLCGDKIVIVGGGLSYYDYERSVLLFDMRTNECKLLRPLPYGVNSIATVAWGDHVIIIGGKNEDGDVLNTVMMYNINTGRSYMLPSMKYKRLSCTAVVSKNIVVVMGGLSDRNQFLDVVEYFCFDSYSWAELPCMNVKRSSPTAVVKPATFG